MTLAFVLLFSWLFGKPLWLAAQPARRGVVSAVRRIWSDVRARFRVLIPSHP